MKPQQLIQPALVFAAAACFVTHKVTVSVCEASEACEAGLALSYLMLADTSVYAVSASSAGLGVLL